MIRFTLNRVIDHPIEEVFDQLADIDGYREWMSRDGLFRECVNTSKGRIDTGTQFYDQASFGRLQGEVTELTPPTRIAFRQVLRRNGTPIFESRPGYELKAVGNRTAIRHVAEAELHGLYKLLEPLIYPIARAERKRVLDSLEDSLA